MFPLLVVRPVNVMLRGVAPFDRKPLAISCSSRRVHWIVYNAVPVQVVWLASNGDSDEPA